MILRCICPIIVSPDLFDTFRESPSSTNRRGLVIISKVIQHIARQEVFGLSKEIYMCSFNSLIESFFEPFNQFTISMFVSNRTKWSLS